jgi:hypothetical protein
VKMKMIRRHRSTSVLRMNIGKRHHKWHAIGIPCDGGPRSAAQLVLTAFRIGSKKRAPATMLDLYPHVDRQPTR